MNSSGFMPGFIGSKIEIVNVLFELNVPFFGHIFPELSATG